MLFLAMLLLGQVAAAEPHRTVVCQYKFMSMPFSEVQLEIVDGEPADYVTVITQGRKHMESFTADELGPNMVIHGWIAQGLLDSGSEMIVYRESPVTGQSVLIDQQSEGGREVWGHCDDAGRR